MNSEHARIVKILERIPNYKIFNVGKFFLCEFENLGYRINDGHSLFGEFSVGIDKLKQAN